MDMNTDAALPDILIVGVGALGSAISTVLSRKGYSLSLWDRDSARPTLGKTLAELVPAAKMILVCVPSFAVRAVIGGVAPSIRKGAFVVCFAKGLEEGTGKTVDQVLSETLPAGTTFAVVGGPMLAAEMAAGSPSIALVASTDAATASEVRTLFMKTNVRVSTTDDVRGVALSGVLKNVYVVAMGVGDGLGMSANEKGWLLAQALHEMVGIGESLGAKRDTVIGSAGLADLVATAWSTASRNHQSGIELAQGIYPDIKGEGIVSLPAVIALIGAQNRTRFPLLDAVAKIAIDRAPAKETFEEYIKTAP